MARSLLLVLQDRLGHEVWFPDASLAQFASVAHPGAWLMPLVSDSGGIPEKHLNQHGNVFTCSRDEFMEKDWGAVVISRPESVPIFRQLLDQHPNGKNIKRIGQAGNEGQCYPWDWIPNFLSSDYLSYIRAPKEINKIHYMQELGRQFQPSGFIRLTEESLRTINTYINCFSSFNHWKWEKDTSWWGGRCPHCDGNAATGETVSPYGIWNSMASTMPEVKFMDFGIGNTCGSIPEKELPGKIIGSSLTFAFKSYDGYGHSIAQSVSMGRLCLVPRRFHRYRTANQFLIPNLTCLEVDWNAESCSEAIRWFTSSLDRANAYSHACFMAARGIFNWEKEALRVGEFIEKLI